MRQTDRVLPTSPEHGLPVVMMRGGTSKGIFLHEADVPGRGPTLDTLLLDLMGSPDPMQIDGLGGTHSSTSKVVIVCSSSVPGIHVDYWFAQVGVDSGIVDWSGNCGNLTTAVAPFAIEEGLVPAEDPITTVLLRNRNTNVTIQALVPTEAGRPKTSGTFAVAGVPRPGAPITTNYLYPAGGVLGRTFPSGSRADVIDTLGGPVRTSLVDVTHPYAIVRAADVGIRLDRDSPETLNADADLLNRLDLLRGKCAQLLGLVDRPDEARLLSPAVPRLLLVDAPSVSVAGDCDLVALGFSMSRIHHALPMTGALCLGATAAIQRTVVAEITSSVGGQLRISHPKGLSTVTMEVGGDVSDPEVRSVGVIRTARRLITGRAHLPVRDLPTATSVGAASSEEKP